jgi:VanZ family protein
MGLSGSSRVALVLHWLPAAIAIAVIAGESTATMGAGHTSRWLLPIWIHLFGPISPERWDVVHHYIRKTGHFVGYGLVSLSFFYGWRYSLSQGRSQARSILRTAIVLALVCTLIVASADEFHQSFVPGRTSSPFDVALDMCGALLMQLVVMALFKLSARSGDSRMVPA